MHLFNYLFIYLFIHSFTHSFIHSFIHLPADYFVRAFPTSNTYNFSSTYVCFFVCCVVLCCLYLSFFLSMLLSSCLSLLSSFSFLRTTNSSSFFPFYSSLCLPSLSVHIPSLTAGRKQLALLLYHPRHDGD